MAFHMQSKNCNNIKRDIGRHILNSLNFSHHLPILLQTVIVHYFDLDRNKF